MGQFLCQYYNVWASQGALIVKNQPANTGEAKDVGSIPGWEDPLE